jgi:hypothetical protein
MTIQHPLILQLDQAGNPSKWITYETAAYYIAKDLVAWTYGSEEYKIYGGKNRVTLSQSSMSINTIMAIKGKMGDKHIHRTPPLTNKALFRRDQQICAYCGTEFVMDKLTRDHIIPTSRNGKDIWTNVVTSCGSCNKRKDNHLLDEIKMDLLYVPYAPSKSEHLILSNRNILIDQMEFLMSKVGANSRLHQLDFKESITHKKQH